MRLKKKRKIKDRLQRDDEDVGGEYVVTIGNPDEDD
jgi:hypothetical protein